MNKTPEQLLQELKDDFINLSSDLGFSIQSENIDHNLENLLKLFHTYEVYRNSILKRGRDTLNQVFTNLPQEIKNNINQTIIKKGYDEIK